MKTGKLTGIRKADNYPGYSVATIEHAEKKKDKKGVYLDKGDRESRVLVSNDKTAALTLGGTYAVELVPAKAAKSAARDRLKATMSKTMSDKEETAEGE